MLGWCLLLLLLLPFWATAAENERPCYSEERIKEDCNSSSVHDFSLQDGLGHEFALKTLSGKSVLFYYGMNALHKKYESSGFQIIAIPCNQFGFQEPAANHTEIMHGIHYVRPGSGFLPSFRVMKKVDVNGKKEIKLYTFLKCACPETTPLLGSEEMFWKPYKSTDIRWNFGKFLVNAKGVPIMRFHPAVEIFPRVAMAVKDVLEKK